MVDGEVTTLTAAAPKTSSLRTTVPIGIVRQFKLDEGDKLEWEMAVTKGKLSIVVKPRKNRE